MNNETETQYVLRDELLRLLSDAEVARVSTAEADSRLCNGEDYVDLEDLGRGVQKANDATVSTGRLLPKNAVHDATWLKIVAALRVFRASTAHSPA